MFDLIWDVYQQAKIESNEKEARHALAKASLAHAEVTSVDQKLDRLTLITAALWEIVQERHGVTEVDLAKKMLEIDVRDGVQDGKLGYEPTKCKSCGRTISTKHMSCLYCGTDSERKAKNIFR
jgi:t-SNARE complex subunit (syntaxin)